MTTVDSWRAAFPISQAEAAKAVTALYESWRIMTQKRRRNFHPETKESHLTRVLKTYVERVTARDHGLLGFWAAEPVHNEIDFNTGELIDERRTDILYAWNDDQIQMQLVFEFKKLNRFTRSQDQYLGENGLGRFVSGIYGQGQPIAVMVGILTDPRDQVVPKLIAKFSNSNIIEALRICYQPNGDVIEQPSQLFQEAEFDTKHERNTSQDTIRIGHLFLEFGY